MIGIGTAVAGAAAGAGLNTIGNIIGTEQQAYHQRQLQEDQQEFAREQAQNQIKYNVQQMKDLGYSPSMLFDHGNATSGGTGAGGQGHVTPNNIFGNGIISGINAVGSLIKDQRHMDLENKRLFNQERMIDLEEKRLNNQIGGGYYNNYNQRNYKKDDFKNVFDNLDNVEI